MYHVVANDLRSGIEAATYKIGDKLPSEPELMRSFGISRGTAVKAIEVLVGEGLATRKQGAGTFVAGASLRREPGGLRSFTETLAAQGRVAGQQNLSFAAADKAVCAALGCFETAMQLTRLRLVDGVRISVHRSIVPLAIMNCLSKASLQRMQETRVTDFSLYAALKEAGIDIASAHEFVTARLATADEYELLSLPNPSAVMHITRQSRTADGRLIEVTEAVYRADTYTYETSLSQSASGPTPLQLRDLGT